MTEPTEARLVIEHRIRQRTLMFVSVASLMIAARFAPEIRPFLMGAGIVALFFEGRPGREKALVFIVAYVGFSPLLSWFDGAARLVDPALLASVLSLCMTGGSMRRRPGARTIHAFALVPAATAVAWWLPIYRGTRIRLLKHLLVGWDHFGHFDLFASARLDGVFRFVTASRPGSPRLFNSRYPAGIHSAWAYLWRPVAGATVTRGQLLDEYSMVVVGTLAGVSFVIAWSLLRLLRSDRRGWSPRIAVVIVVVGLVVFGHLSMSLWGGFPNYGIAIAAAVVLASVGQQPIVGRIPQLIVVSGAILIIAYNWHPLLIPVAGLVLLHVVSTLVGSGRQLRAATLAWFFATGVASLAPIVLTFRFGVDHLALDGGFPSPNPNSVVMTLAAGFTIKAMVWNTSERRSWIQLLLSPAVLGLVAALGMTVAIRLGPGGYPYYQKKIVYGICMIALFDVFMSVLRRVDAEPTTGFTNGQMLIRTAQLMFGALALTQLFGYAGPDWTNFAPTSAVPGLSMPRAIKYDIERLGRPAVSLLSIESQFRTAPERTRSCVVLADLDHQDYDPILTNYWVGSMLGVVSEEHISRAQKLAVWLTQTLDPHENAWTINNTLDIAGDCPAVSEKIREWLIAIDGRWEKRTLVVESDGSLVVPKEFQP